MNPDQLYGIGELDAIFRNHPKTVVPWPAAPRRKHMPLVPDGVVRSLSAAPVIDDVDPRRLHATQTWVVRHHAAYYLTGTWERNGRPSANLVVPSNRWPLVLTDQAGRLVILGGHHRALAALVTGRPLRARLIPAEPATTIAVTPHLLIGPTASCPHIATNAADQALMTILHGDTALVPDEEIAALVLTRLGLTPEHVCDRLEMATTGRTLTAA